MERAPDQTAMALAGTMCLCHARAEALGLGAAVLEAFGARTRPATSHAPADLLFTSGSGLTAAFVILGRSVDDQFTARFIKAQRDYRSCFLFSFGGQKQVAELGRACWLQIPPDEVDEIPALVVRRASSISSLHQRLSNIDDDRSK